MKSFTAVVVVVLALFALGASSKNIGSKVADKDFLVKQKFIFDVLQHIYQDDVFVHKYDTSFYEYKPWEHVADYLMPEKLESFFELWQHDPLDDEEVFSVMYDKDEEYAVGLVRVFFFAKSWETFTHAVFWARQHVNKQLFVYALTIASLFRHDLNGIVMPALYEIHPWSFFDAETIQMAEQHKMQGFHHVKKLDNLYNVVIKSNYSNVYGDVNYDHTMAYLLEDVGFNAFYYYFNIDYPFWTVGNEEYQLNKDRRGELYLFVHWQLLARVYLERLSNDMGEIPIFNMYESYPTGYFSGLNHYNGIPYPNRVNEYNFYDDDNVEDVNNVWVYTQRIMDWIHKNDKYDIDVVNTLGNMVQGNLDSIDKKYYGSIDKWYHHIVNEGRPYGPHRETLPSVLMQYQTSLRDPLFYSMYKTILMPYWNLMDTFPEYTHKDLNFEGVKIDAVHMPESLTTYFESFDADISNAVNVEPITETGADALLSFGRNSQNNGHSYVIKARQQRLNHKPFEISVDVTSDKAQQAVVKVFIGPKYDENGRVIHLDKNYMNFFELEHIKVDLVAGVNTIKRNSGDFTWWVNDRTTYLELYQKLMDATNSDYKFKLDQSEAHCGVPNRIMLPRGKKGGMTYQFVFVVYPYQAPSVDLYTGYDPIVSCGVGHGSRFVDSLPFGFPFNRPVHHEYYFDVDNIQFQDVKIFHRDEHTNLV